MNQNTIPQSKQISRSYSNISHDGTQSTVYTTTTSDGRIIAWVRKHGNPTCKQVILICRTCTSRATSLMRYAGPKGPLLFQDEPMPTQSPEINSIYANAEEACQGEYTIELVQPTTFPPRKYTGCGPRKNEEFNHITIEPSHITDPTMDQRMIQLWPKVQHSVRERLSKFLCEGARQTMILINSIIGSGRLVRPGYWAPTCEWILDIQRKFPENFDEMSSERRDELCVYSMAIGHASCDVHYNFQTSANFIDFMVMTSEQAIANEMDKRSDPRTNQVSQLARAKEAKGVVAKWGIGLIWDGRLYRDDLDLRCVTSYGTVYFMHKELIRNGKVVAKQDFDAGISGTEAQPAENISFSEDLVGMPIDIFIDNYSRRTIGDVPCQIIITQQGLPDRVIDVVWPRDRREHHYLHVATHVFTPIIEPVVTMSETQARAAAAQDKEWNELFGTPTSTIATLENLNEYGFKVVQVPEDTAHVSQSSTMASTTAMSEFASLVANGRQTSNTGTQPKPAKQFLSARLKNQPPTTVEELVLRLASTGEIIRPEIHLQDFVPGYMTNITVASDKALKSGKTSLSMCHYEDKFQQPLKPVKTGNARLNETWVKKNYSGNVRVIAIVKVEGKYFFVLDGAQLSPDDVAFPKSAGFYPQDLSNDGHKHRSKWAFLNSSIRPQMPASDAVPAIGTFLTSDFATVIVNGQKLVLRV